MPKGMFTPFFLCVLRDAGTLLTVVTWRLSAARGRTSCESSRRDEPAPLRGAKSTPKVEGPPAGTNPLADEERREQPAPPSPGASRLVVNDGTNVLKDKQ